MPAGLRTSIKLQNSTWYSWPTNCAVIRCQTIEWNPASTKLMIRDGTFGLSSGFQDHITRKKSRPADVAVPQPQSGALTLSYDGHALTVPFLITYELNRNYDSANGTENCGSGLVVIAGVLLLLISAGIALPVLVLARLISRWSRRGRS